MAHRESFYPNWDGVLPDPKRGDRFADQAAAYQAVDQIVAELLKHQQILASGGGGSAAPLSATYITVGANASLTDERVLTAGTGITLSDGGANGLLTIQIDTHTHSIGDISGILPVAQGGLGANNSATSGVLEFTAGTPGYFTVTAFAKTLLDDANAATALTTLGIGSTSSPTFAGLTINGNIAVTGNVDGVDVASHQTRHLDGGADPLDADKLEVTYVPTNYTRTVSPAEVDQLDQLTAHLAGIDAAISAASGAPIGSSYVVISADASLTAERVLVVGSGLTLTDNGAGSTVSLALDAHTHVASTDLTGTVKHENGGLEADVSLYNGLVKISAGATSQVTLSAFGTSLIDDADATEGRSTLGLGSSDSPTFAGLTVNGSITVTGTVDGVDVSAHKSRHVRGGGDELDGDILAITYTPSNYTRTISPVEVSDLTELTAHLAGIDNKIAELHDHAPTGAQYLTLATDAELTNERVLTAGTGISFADGGAGSTLTVSLGSHTHNAATDLTGLVPHENGGLEANVAAFSGVVKIAAGATSALSTGATGETLLATATAAAARSALSLDTANSPTFAGLTINGNIAVTGTVDGVDIADHNARHILGGSDEIDADVLGVSWNPANYTPATVATFTTSVDHLTSHLKGIDDAIGAFTTSAPVGASYLTLGTDATLTSERVLTQGSGITLSDAGPGSTLTVSLGTHAGNHIRSGSDIIDADRLVVDFTPANYAPDPLAPTAGHADDLAAHLKGIDDQLGTTGAPVDAQYVVLTANGTLTGERVLTQGSGISISSDATTVTVALGTHAANHIEGGGDAIDADMLSVTWVPSNYTRDLSPAEVTTTTQLTAHLKGIDTALSAISGKAANSEPFITLTASGTLSNERVLTAGNNVTIGSTSTTVTIDVDAHAGDHINGGTDVMDGDKLDISFNPTNSTPATNAFATNVDQLAAHLQGIDNELAGFAALDHDATHIQGGSDEVDGDMLDIDFSPANYTRTLVATVSTDLAQLTSHLKGIDLAIGGTATKTPQYVVLSASADLTNERVLVAGTNLTAVDGGAGGNVTLNVDSHAGDHILGGGDVMDGDHIDITYTPTNYTPSIVPAEASNVDHLAAHLAGIDDALATAGGAPETAQYLTLATDATLTSERVLTAGTNISFTDGGAGSTLTISADNHQAQHISGGSQAIDGDQLDITYIPASGYSRETVTGTAPSLVHLTAHLKGISTALTTLDVDKVDDSEAFVTIGNSGNLANERALTGGSYITVTDNGANSTVTVNLDAHGVEHVTGGSDILDADILNITYTPSNYTRTTVATVTTLAIELTSHLKGIDDALGTIGTFAPVDAEYLVATSNGTLTAERVLTAGTNITLTPAAGLLTISVNAHKADHIRGGSDILDGDRIVIDYAQSNYTPNSAAPTAGHVDDLAAHLAGIDTAIGTLNSGKAATSLPFVTIGNTGSLSAERALAANTTQGITLTDGGGNSSATIGLNKALFLSAQSAEIDADKLDIDWNPTTYVPATAATFTTSVDELTSHLKGIDNYLATVLTGTHAATHISGGSDIIDGDKLQISWTGHAFYTPSTSPTEVTLAEQLTAHLAGIDTALSSLDSSKAVTDHDATHIESGSDEIDADKLGISWTPATYTPTSAPTEVTTTTQLTAHLAGIDAYVSTLNANKASTSHAATHIDGGADAIDGDKLEVTWTPAAYTRDTTPVEVDQLDQLTAHLKGIDTALSTNAAAIATNTADITILDSGKAEASEAFVTIGTTAGLTSERALTAGNGLTLTDGGAGTTVTLAIDPATLIDGGAVAIDGDKVEITWAPSNYTRDTTPTEASAVDQLTAHLYGIDQVLGTIITDHGALAGLTDDDHTQYALLAGRSGGQTLIGGTAASNNLTLESTSNATKGSILLGQSSFNNYVTSTGVVGIGIAALDHGGDPLHVGGRVTMEGGWIAKGNSFVMGDGAGGTVNFVATSGSSNLNFTHETASKDINFTTGGGSAEIHMRKSGSAVSVMITEAQNVTIGPTQASSTGKYNLALQVGTSPTASTTNCVQLYAEDVSASAELKVRDEAGNVTTLSPHNFTMYAPAADDPFPFSMYQKNEHLGLEMAADVSGMYRLIESFFKALATATSLDQLKAILPANLDFLHYKTIPTVAKDLTPLEPSAEKVAAYEKQLAALDAWAAAPLLTQQPEIPVKVAAQTPRALPQWIKDRLNGS